MNNLPTELVGIVVDNLSSISDLLSLRTLNSAYNSLVTPSAFRRVHIKNSVQSAQKCRTLLASPSLAPLVKEVVFDQRDHAQFCLLSAGIEGACDELEIADLEDALTETFCSLPGFVNIESVTLNFWPSFSSQNGCEIREHPFWFANRQITVLHALHHAMESSCIRSLTLNNVVLMFPSSYNFVSALKNSPLHHFSISVVSNSELSTWSGSKAVNGSFSLILPSPTANLKSLVLRSPQGHYHSHNSQLRSFMYPALESIVLENIVFDSTPSPDGIEEFIIRHKDTLQRLELHSCSSYVSDETTPLRRWSTIWKRFDAELVSLTEIVVSDTLQGYALLDDIRGYIPHPSVSVTSAELFEDDRQCMLHLQDRVSRRKVSAATNV